MDERRLSDIGVGLRITGILESGMLHEFDEIKRRFELETYKVHSFYATERCPWIREEISQRLIGIEVNFSKNMREEFFKILGSNRWTKTVEVQGWNIAEIFFFVLSIIAENEKQAIVLMCFTTDLGEHWDLPEEGGFIFSVKSEEGKKINFKSPKL
ncbi:MAG: hypothetical protein ACFFCQ_11730 [Promethearchaeota archaeon]